MTETLTPHELGVLGEDTAVQWFQARGHTIVDRNVRLAGVRGEIDIIAVDNTTLELVFIEVKTRRSDIAGWPEEAITRTKARTLRQLAAQWLRNYDDTPPPRSPEFDSIRFDVLSLLGTPEDGFVITYFPRVI